MYAKVAEKLYRSFYSQWMHINAYVFDPQIGSIIGECEEENFGGGWLTIAEMTTKRSYIFNISHIR